MPLLMNICLHCLPIVKASLKAVIEKEILPPIPIEKSSSNVFLS